MKIKRGLLTLAVMMLAGSLWTAQSDAQEESGEATRKIILSGSGPYKAVYLDEQVYRWAKQDLSDLRIKDDQGKEIPYYIYNTETGVQEESEYCPAEVIDEFVKKDKSYVDIQVSQRENTDQLLSFLQLKIENKNFASSVTVEGSYDGIHWDPINNGQPIEIYSVASGDHMKIGFDHTVKYSYFRIALPTPAEKIIFQEVYGVYQKDTPYETCYERTKESQYTIQEDQAQKTTEIFVDNTDHLRVKKLSLLTEGRFTRSYSLFGMNEAAEGEKSERYFISSGTIQSSNSTGEGKGEAGVACMDAEQYEKLVLVIQNNDDQPITISGIQETYDIDKLVFEASEGRSYVLCYGRADRQKPDYDMVYYISSIEGRQQDEAALGELSFSGETEKVKKDEGYRLLFEVLIGVTSVVLLTVIIGSNRRKMKEKP